MSGMSPDFLVIGGGVVGLSIARELRRRFGGAAVTLIEKEPACAQHASGRNSGVLHAGFYYTADSLKAKFTRDGNRELTAYCEENGIPLRRCGKLVVAQHEGEHAALDELLARGRRNGVPLESIDESEARRIEPRARTCERAIYSPTTSSVDPAVVMRQMEADARREGVRITCGVAYLSRRKGSVLTSAGVYHAGHVVNAAGLYADRVARDFDFSKSHRILPFKGLYLYSDEPVGAIRTHIYPVPNLQHPFLGVHVTVTIDGHAKLGPTAIPAFWREQYRGAENFRLSEFIDILYRQCGLLAFSRFGFLQLAWHELQKYSRRRMVALAAGLIRDLRPEQYRRWGKPGIRAQLINTKERRLEMDFLIEGDDRSTHILNAVSPAFTCSLPFARHVVDGIEQRTQREVAA
jgi:L-2-hydroxyglutarate oxidase